MTQTQKSALSFLFGCFVIIALQAVSLRFSPEYYVQTMKENTALAVRYHHNCFYLQVIDYCLERGFALPVDSLQKVYEQTCGSQINSLIKD